MRLKITEFFRKYAVRRDGQLAIPRTFPVNSFEFPTYAITHWFPDDTTSFGPENTDPVLAQSAPAVYIEHIAQYVSNEGNPRYRPADMARRIMFYRRNHRAYRKVMREEMVKQNRKNILLVNYAPMDHAYVYRESYKRNWWKFHNHVNTLVAQINAHAVNYQDWHQFISVYLPEDLPTRQHLMQTNVDGVPSRQQLKFFDTEDKLLYRELWRWMSDETVSAFDALTEEARDKLFLFVHNGDRFAILHVGTLFSWRDTPEDGGNVKPDQLQRRLLAFFLRVRYSSALEDIPEDQLEESEAEVTSQTKGIKGKTTAKKKTDVTDSDLDDLSGLFKAKRPPVSVAPPTSGAAPKLEDTPYFDDTVTEEDRSESKEEELKEEESEPLTGEIYRIANDLRDNRRITKATYNTILKEAEAYKTMKDPYGLGITLDQLRTVTKEDIAMPPTKVANDRTNITDKSLLHASTSVVNKKYVTEVMKKDIAAAILSVQRRGVIVKDYKVERHDDAMTRYETHKFTLKPVGGRPTTVDIYIPLPDKYGKLKVNNKLYTLRMQRVDMPIRKVKPDRVALTSYFRKLFVERTKRRSHDLGRFITRLLVERADNPEDKRVTKYVLRNVFNKQYDVPYYYSLIAERIAELQVSYNGKPVTLYFDYAHKDHHFTEDELKSLKPNLTPIGKLEGNLLAVDDQNQVHKFAGSQWSHLTSFQAFLDIYDEKAPVNYTEMKISDKVLPVGFILAYIYGIDKLVKLLGCRVERYPSNTRVEVPPECYRLVFDDEQWILERDDTVASMILSGLLQFKATLKRHTAHEFNGADVYYLMLDNAGLNSRYLVEIDDLLKSWMDPITEGHLKDMGEPTTLPELIIRGVELLRTRWSPEEMDARYMRTRTHERFAGALFKELHLAIKARDRRDSNGDTRIEVNPFSVWQSIMDDPAILAVREANPIQNLREQEGMTYRGEGGRSDQTMKADARKFLKTDIGDISESTPDSGAVGIIAYKSPDANIINLRGQTRQYDPKTDGNAKLFSSTLLLSPSADQDDRIRSVSWETMTLCTS